MKKILFVIPSFMHGGTNRSSCNTIDLFDFGAHGIEVDLLCIKGMSEKTYLNEFKNRGVNILPENFWMTLRNYKGKKPFIRFLKKIYKYLPSAGARLVDKAACLRYGRKYDAVVAMEEGIATQMASYIKAPKRIAWLRCMYDRYFENNNRRDESGFYDKFNSVVCVSEECRKSLIAVYPQYSEKAVCIPNAPNRELILKKSEEKTDIEFDGRYFNIVSVGRLNEVKQFHLIPEVTRKLLDSGLSVKWYIVGDGHDKNRIAEEIKKYNVEENVLLIGSRANPYPIMKKADLVAVTSYSESFCLVISEGIILARKVISTPFPAVYDTMRDYKNGFICNLSDFPNRIMSIASSDKNEDVPVISSNKEDRQIVEFVKKLEKLF